MHLYIFWQCSQIIIVLRPKCGTWFIFSYMCQLYRKSASGLYYVKCAKFSILATFTLGTRRTRSQFVQMHNARYNMEEGPLGDDEYTRVNGESRRTQQAHNRFPPAPTWKNSTVKGQLWSILTWKTTSRKLVLNIKIVALDKKYLYIKFQVFIIIHSETVSCWQWQQ